MEMSGASATKETHPKASVMTEPDPQTVLHAPIAMGSTKEETIAPLATPPESKAIPVNMGGVKKVSPNAMTYPGIRKNMMLTFRRMRSMASPMAQHTPMHSPFFIADELLALQIASIHNLAFYLWLVREARKHIIAGDFTSWKKEMVVRVTQRL